MHINAFLAASLCLLVVSCSKNPDQTTPDGASDGGTDGGSVADAGADSGADTDTDSDTDPVIVEDCDGGWCIIPAGGFIYGTFTSEPCRVLYAEDQFEVTLTRSFTIKQTEVTQAEWQAVGFPNPAKNTIAPDVPVFFVNHFEAMAYANALSEAEGFDTCYDLSACVGTVGSGCPDGTYYEHGCIYQQEVMEYLPDLFRCEGDVHRYPDWYACLGYRLPTDAEWEYAARAGATGSTWIGEITTGGNEGENGCDDPVADAAMWYCGNADTPQPVGGKYKNGWGLYDALGNVEEWTDNVYIGLPLDTTAGQEPPIVDPIGDADGGLRSQRGGSYRDVACHSRLGMQGSEFAETRGEGSGIRLVRTVFDEMSAGMCVWR
jgi:sulfatase modifying factor 1